MRFLRAFAWLRWRLLANSLRAAESRDVLERVSRVTALVAPGFLLATSVSSVVAAIVLGTAGGWISVTYRFQSSWVLPTVRVALLLATVFAVFVPLFSGMRRGGAARFARLLLLPIPRRTLHFVEVVSSLTDPWVVFVFPGLVGFAAGKLAAAILQPNGWMRYPILEALVALVAAVGMALVLSSLSSLVTFLVSWVVRDRRRSELFVVVLVIVLSVVSIVPAIVSTRIGSAAIAAGGLPGWTAVLPSELYGEALAPGLRWIPLVVLLLEGAFFYVLSFVAHEQLLASTEGGRIRRHRRAVDTAANLRVPGMWPGTSAVAVAQARSALRSVRGRLVLLLPGPLTGMIAILFRSMPAPAEWSEPQGHLLLAGGILLGLYAAQPFTMNQFGSDRAGLTLQFLAPIRDVDLIRGKAVGCGAIIAGGALITLLCTLLAAPYGSPLLWTAAIFGGVATYVVLTPLGALFSVLLPVPADLSKTGTSGNPHTLAILAGMVFVGLAAVPPGVALLMLSPRAALVAMTIWLATVWVAVYPLLGLVARLLRARRENLALIAQGR
jgi:hypothetical protein